MNPLPSVDLKDKRRQQRNERLDYIKKVNKLTEAQEARLIEIILQHTRLTKEHIQPQTTHQRRKEIKKEIESLVAERKSIICK